MAPYPACRHGLSVRPRFQTPPVPDIEISVQPGNCPSVICFISLNPYSRRNSRLDTTSGLSNDDFLSSDFLSNDDNFSVLFPPRDDLPGLHVPLEIVAGRPEAAEDAKFNEDGPKSPVKQNDRRKSTTSDAGVPNEAVEHQVAAERSLGPLKLARFSSCLRWPRCYKSDMLYLYRT